MSGSVSLTAKASLFQGFNTWNAFACDGINASVMMRTADLFVKLGLKDLGYLYVGMDACWMQKNVRDNSTGQQLVNLTKFPGGFNQSIGHIHKLGLKAGICKRPA